MTNFDVQGMRNTIEYNKALIQDLAMKGMLDFVVAKRHLKNLNEIGELYNEIMERADIVGNDGIFASHKLDDKLNAKMALKLIGVEA